jgi:hypothetical protein
LHPELFEALRLFSNHLLLSGSGTIEEGMRADLIQSGSLGWVEGGHPHKELLEPLRCGQVLEIVPVNWSPEGLQLSWVFLPEIL